MRRRDEKRREFHEALLQTLYPPPSSPPSSPSPSPSPSPVEFVNEEPFDVTLINPEDYLKIDSSNHRDDIETGDETGIAEKPSRAQRKRLRKKMLKEEAARRKKVIGPLLPTEMFQTSNGEEEEASCLQHVRPNAQEKKEELDGDVKIRKVKKRREAKKQAKETSNKPVHIHDPTAEIPN